MGSHVTVGIGGVSPYIHTLHDTFDPQVIEGQKCHEALLKISDPSTRPIHFPVLAPYNIFEDI